jgi:GAF domain-containing protein
VVHNVLNKDQMITAIELSNEKRRLNALKSLPNVNAVPERQFDRITTWARHQWNCPIAVIAFVKQSTVIFKSLSGVHANEVQRYGSLFEHTIRSYEPTFIADALKDARFSGDDFVQLEKIRSYAAAPVRTLEGYQLGAVCIMDRVPRLFAREDMQELERLAALVADELEAPGYQEYAGKLGIDLLFTANACSTFAA